MPVQSVNINNVSMDYFLRGVEAAKPKDAPQMPQKAQAGANAQLRSEASVRADVAAIAANFAELRQLAANDP